MEACQRMSEMKIQKQQQEKLEEKDVLEFYKEKAVSVFFGLLVCIVLMPVEVGG